MQSREVSMQVILSAASLNQATLENQANKKAEVVTATPKEITAQKQGAVTLAVKA